jgi:uncharacterized protein
LSRRVQRSSTIRRGKDNVYGIYDGTAGVAIGRVAPRALVAAYFGDINILLSSYITSETQILFRRNIQDRVQTIASFLRLDHDPYVVISNGRLFWMQDAYTTSSWFPYAQPVAGDGINYIRNSIKVVIDAYNGAVEFYVADSSDPIAATYRRIFPFKPFEPMPPELQHMDAPEVFYNREDLWQFPRPLTGIEQAEGARNTRMVPYYKEIAARSWRELKQKTKPKASRRS